MRRILLLDDDDLFCRSLRDILLRAPDLTFSDVEVATSAEKATQKVIRSVEEKQPFDIFLIDQYLKNRVDGIETMAALRRISPTTDAIVLTGMGDAGSGQRAYSAGASRYLQKPFESDELFSILQSLEEWRQVQRERAWMQVLIEISEAAEQVHEFEAVAQVVVSGALRLGFARARLFWVQAFEGTDEAEMVGICMAGTDSLEDFKGCRFLIEESPYARAARQSKNLLFFHQRRLGPGVMEQCFGEERFSPPAGEWACLPLWSGERFSGILSLDNGDHEILLSDDLRKLLELYARQAVAILERARLFGRERHNRREIQLINEIGKQIMIYVNDLDTLLEQIRIQMKKRFDVDNFFVALVNEDMQKLDFRLHYEHGRRKRHHLRKIHAGLAGHLVSTQARQPLYLPDGSQSYCQANGIRAFGEPARCWLGIPLWVANRMIGVMALQHYKQARVFTQHDVDLLWAITNHVVGAIYVSQIVEREEERLSLLQKASAELVRLAIEDENWMWRALLTIISANYGLRFNRAWLFLAEAANTRLSGVFGIGRIDLRAAHQDWERDLRRKMTFDRFLVQLREGKLRRTPLEDLTPRLTFTDQESAPEGQAAPKGLASNALFQVIQTGQRMSLSAGEVAGALPADFVAQFDLAECAIVPLKAGDHCIGLVIVDNRHSGEPIEAEVLDQLETFLNMAGLVYLNEQRRVRQEALLNATNAIVQQSEKTHLKDTLDEICKVAQAVNDADWVTIYPLKNSGPNEYDVNHIGRAGKLIGRDKPVKDKPRMRGVAAYLMHSGRLVVNDVQSDLTRVDGQLLRQHPFIVREKIQAFIAFPVIDTLTAEPLGVIYLDWRKTQRFSAEDIQRAATFANLAGIAIRNARLAEQGLASQRELNILQSVLKGALAYPEEQVIVRILLNAMRQLAEQEFPTTQEFGAGKPVQVEQEFDVGKPAGAGLPAQFEIQRVECRVVLAGWETRPGGHLPEQVLRPFVYRPDSISIDCPLSQVERGWIATALETGRAYLDEDHSHLISPIKTGLKALGVLYIVARDEIITLDLQRALDRLAAIAALVLDNLHRQTNLVSALESARAFTAPSSLEDTLNAIVRQVRRVSPELSALTIWYYDRRSEKVKQGASFGLLYPDLVSAEIIPAGTVVQSVMEASEPMWAEDVFLEQRVLREFVHREQILSVAAFPLRADNEVVGAMFFNYRRLHRFSQEEKSLFSLLAEIVAASILDASRLEERQRESARLEATLNITDAMGASLELSQVITRALEQLYNLLEYTQTIPCLLTYDENQRVLEFVPETSRFYRVDNPEERGTHYLRLTDLAIVTRVARQSLRERKAAWVNVPDVDLDVDYRRMIQQTKSELCVSLFSGEKLLGVLALESPIQNAFEEEEVRLVMGIAQQISLAIERAQQINRLQFKETVATATAWATEIAHDINREVGRIREHVYWIKEDPHDAEGIIEHLHKIDESAIKLSSVGPWGNVADKPFNVHRDLRAWIDGILRNSGEGVSVRYDLGCEGMIIRINTVGLERVLRHLVRNSLQAMQYQGQLIVRAAPNEEEGSLSLLEIQIEDSGPGIDETLRPLLFQKPVPGKKGGYGLLLVRQIVEGMGGTIWALPGQPGRGAVFCIRLPIKAQ